MNVKMGNVAARDSYYPFAAPSKHFPSVLDDMTDTQVIALAEKEGIPVKVEQGGQVVGDAKPELLRQRLAGKVAFRDLPGNRVTEIGIPGDTPLNEAFASITHITNGLWKFHSSAPPAWIESDSEGLAMLLSEHYKCPIGRPDDWDGMELGGRIGPNADQPAGDVPVTSEEGDDQ